MKNKIVYLFILLTAVIACSDDFTEQTAFGSLSDESLKNADGIDLLLIGAYSMLDGHSATGGDDWFKAGDNWWFDVMSDDAHKGSTDGDQADLFLLETYDWGSANPYTSGKWRALYAGVNRANSVLAQIGLVTEGDFSQQLAEARFLRGFFNLELQKIFGNVSYISEENFAALEFNQPNTGPIWDKIEADFEYAVANLPNTQGQVGRATAWAAKAFLGKTHLYQSDWAAAYTSLNDVVTNGPFSLNAEFTDNFRIAGDNSPESLLAIQFTADETTSFNGNRGATLNFTGPNGWCCGFYQASQDLVNAYQTAAGLPLLDTYKTSDVASDYNINSSDAFTLHAGPLDPRLDYTVGRRGIEYNGYGVHPGKDWIRASFADISGPFMTKKNVYNNGEDANQGTGGWGEQRSGINYHLMRFADVLLMAAEAAAETGNTAVALNYVNQVRNRAKNMTYVKDAAGADAANYVIEPYASFPDAAYAVKAVRFERRLELGVEGHRLFDLRRWGNSASVISEYILNEARTITPFGVAANAYQSKHDLSPIPLNAIDQSQGVIQQNTGY